MTKLNLQAPRGTRDFYPDELRQRSWLFAHFRAVAKSFAFEEVDAPVVEHAELFTRKAGEEIVEQLYHFVLHERELALRPEMTPSIARMVLARAGALRFPLRWFAITQNWRYERMTRGRTREHYQWNMDIWGEPSVAAEAELMAAIFTLFDRVQVPRDDVRIRVNSRALLEESLRATVLKTRPEIFAPLCVVIDKLAKIGRDAVIDLLQDPQGDVRLAKVDAVQVVDMLSARSLDAASAYAPKGATTLDELRRFFDLLAAYGIEDRVVFDASTVRGLAYYTGIVFEAFDTAGELRAICGGGRYDRLTELLGGKAIPAVGFGFGDVVIGELLKDRNLLPALRKEVHDVVFAFSDAEHPFAVRLASRLRSEGRYVELILGANKLKRVLGDADRLGAERIFLLGPDEISRGVAKQRNLKTGEETDLTL